MKKVITGVLLSVVCFGAGFLAGTHKEKNKEVKEIITEIREDFYLESGDIAIVFEDDSYIIYNPAARTEQ